MYAKLDQNISCGSRVVSILLFLSSLSFFFVGGGGWRGGELNLMPRFHI